MAGLRLRRTSEKQRSVIRVSRCDAWRTRGDPGGFIGSCGESVQPLQSENYSNSRVHGYGRLGRHDTYAEDIWFIKRVFQNSLGKVTSGTGGIVPGRYGGELEKMFWSY